MEDVNLLLTFTLICKTIAMPLKSLLRITFELEGGLKDKSIESQKNSFSIIMEHTNYINLMIIKSFTQSSQYYRKNYIWSYY